MGHKFPSSEKSNCMLTEMERHQRRDVLLCIDEILTALDTASPTVDQRNAARRFVQLIEGNKFAAMAGVPIGAAHGAIDAKS